MKQIAANVKPLTGVRVVVSRARKQAGALSDELKELGATVFEIPFIEIRKPHSFAALDHELQRASEYHWLILTSVNGVEALFGRMAKLGIGAESLLHLSIAAIGPATKSAIEGRGLKVDVVPNEYVAESVVGAVKEHVQGQRVLLVRAKVARDVIPNELRKSASRVDVVEAYETIVPAKSRERLLAVLKDGRRRPHVITFTSSSTARNFLQLVGKQRPNSRLLEDIKFASIGPVTSETLRQSGLPPHIQASEYTVPGLVRAIREAFEKD